MKCNLVFHAAVNPMGIQSAVALSVALCRCETHGISVEGPVAVGDMCPIGKIEAAVEAGLAKITAALKVTP